MCKRADRRGRPREQFHRGARRGSVAGRIDRRRNRSPASRPWRRWPTGSKMTHPAAPASTPPGVCPCRRACNAGGMASRYAAARRRLAGPRWSVLLAGLRHPRRFFADLLERIGDDNILTVAAALSYYFFFAFFPLLLFLLAVVTLLP